MGRTVHSRLIVCVKSGQLVPIRRGVGDIGVLVVRVDGTQRIRKRHAKCLGVLQGQPDMLVLFLPMVMAVALHVLAEILTGHVSREEGWPRLFRINDGVKALVAHSDVEMLGRS